MLLVEHNMDVVMDISRRVVVLDHGQKIAEGPPEVVRRDPKVIEACFGRWAVLRIDDVHAGYGEIEVLRGVSAQVARGEIVSIIGANGAGKSTLLRTVFGMVRPSRGGIRLGGEEIAGESPVRVLRRGCSYVPQGRCNFPAMSVEENLEMGAYTRSDGDVPRDIEAMLARFPVLGDQAAGAGGDALGRAAADPRDRDRAPAPAEDPPDRRAVLGLDPRMVEIVFATIAEVNRAGAAVLMVEQNAKQALAISHRAFVLELGRNRFEGTGQALLENPDVRAHYLGG